MLSVLAVIWHRIFYILRKPVPSKFMQKIYILKSFINFCNILSYKWPYFWHLMLGF